MTDLKVVRYNGIEQDDEGVYVMHSDYARLAAEVETWKRHFDKANAEVEVLVLRLQEAEEEPFLGESPLVVDKLRAERDAWARLVEGIERQRDFYQDRHRHHEDEIARLRSALLGTRPPHRAGNCWCHLSRDIPNVGHDQGCVNARQALEVSDE